VELWYPLSVTSVEELVSSTSSSGGCWSSSLGKTAAMLLFPGLLSAMALDCAEVIEQWLCEIDGCHC